MSQNENPFEKDRRKEAIRRAGKKTKIKSNEKNRRQKGSRAGDADEWEEANLKERVMPRGERERRRRVEKMAFKTDWLEEEDDRNAGFLAVDPGDEFLEGRVIEVSSGLCRVERGSQVHLCRLRGSLKAPETGFTNIIAVGDRVRYRLDGGEQGVVESILPRHSALARPDVFHSHLKQVIVANADQLLIVMSWRDPNIWLELVDRYLITARLNRLEAVLCITKIDLVESQAELRETLQPYRQMDIPILLTSAQTGAGLFQLEECLIGKMTILAGLSGVGKTSLLMALQPNLGLRTGAVGSSPTFRGQGRHTTTQVSLIRLANGAVVVDTPGIREFGLASLRKPDLAACYPEFSSHVPRCRFNNCLHLEEPDCAVRRAVEQGEISPKRYKNYRNILATLRD